MIIQDDEWHTNKTAERRLRFSDISAGNKRYIKLIVTLPGRASIMGVAIFN